mmetsp:Transcript_47104/g.87496  ORF Transcript_47104/g.87496 Transcript_47104/m.87496 type:complete len:171 (-) Transcript_47104:208-720(-)
MRAHLAVVLSSFTFSLASAFVVPAMSTKYACAIRAPGAASAESIRGFELNMVDPAELSSAVASTSSMMLAETEPWVQPLASVLGPFLNIFSFAMLCRVVISWYPTTNVNELPFNIVVWPTEPLLRAIRGLVPPAFGVDITPIVWLAVFSFFNEILLGQQGLLTMKIKYGI